MHGFKLCKFNLNQLHQNVIHIEVGCKESGYNLIRSEDANYIKQFEIVKEDIICTENCNNLYDRSGTAQIWFSSTLLTKYIFGPLKYIFGWK